MTIRDGSHSEASVVTPKELLTLTDEQIAALIEARVDEALAAAWIQYLLWGDKREAR